MQTPASEYERMAMTCLSKAEEVGEGSDAAIYWIERAQVFATLAVASDTARGER